MKALRIISRILIACVFIFSGFVKLVDPLGSTYKFTDYFLAFHMDFMQPVAFGLGILLAMAEFIIGVSLLIGLRMRITAWAVMIFMTFFTILTFFLALYNPVSDCGCFGDALVITNWETFGKNVVIMIFTIFVFISRNKYKPAFSPIKEWLVVGVFTVFAGWFAMHCYNHLPIIDFRPYKVGTNIMEGMTIPAGAPVDEYKQDFVLKDTTTGKILQIDSKAYTKDSTYWMDGTKWKFLKTTDPILVKEGYHPPIHNFSISTMEGAEITDLVLNDSNYVFLLVAYNLEKTSSKHQKEINNIAGFCQANNFRFICLTSSPSKIIENFKRTSGAMYEFCTADETTLKTVIRSNPGLLLLKKGTVLAMWHHNDLPNVKALKTDMSSYTASESRAKIEKLKVWNIALVFILIVSCVGFFAFYNRRAQKKQWSGD